MRKQSSGKLLRVLFVLAIPAIISVGGYFLVLLMGLLLRAIGLARLTVFCYLAAIAYMVGVKAVLSRAQGLAKKILTWLTKDDPADSPEETSAAE